MGIIGGFILRQIFTGGLSWATDKIADKVTRKRKLVPQRAVKEPVESTTRNFADIILSLGFWVQIATLAQTVGVEQYFGSYAGVFAFVIGVLIKYYRWKTDTAIR
jgi:hypothetical protein